MRYASVVCVSKHVMFTVCVVPITTTCHACIYLHTMHVFHVLCLLPTLPIVEGSEYLVIYFIQMNVRYVSFFLSSCLCSGAGEVLADSVLALRSVTKLCICDINPVPVLRILSQNVEHCVVSTLAIALEYHPELVRSVSMGPCST